MLISSMDHIILTKIFDSLNRSKLQYCVLRNYKSLPMSLDGSDLDLAVLQTELSTIAQLIIGIADNYGGKTIIDYTSSGRIMRFLGCYEGEWWGMAIDLFSKMEYKGVEYISTESIISRAVDYNSIKVSPDYDAEITALIKELLSNGKTRKTYLADAKLAYANHGEKCLELLNNNFDVDVIDDFRKVLVDAKDNQVTSIVIKLRHSVINRDWLKNLPTRIRNFAMRSRRLFNPIGSSIAVLGTDGSGKKMMISAITPVLETALHSKIQYEHLRPNWLPALKLDNSKSKPSRLVGSLVRLSYYTLDYTMGYWIRIYPKLIKRPHLCIFERYYYDFFLEPSRMHIALPQWMIRVAFFAVPQPRLIFCLGSDPQITLARNPETSLEEVARLNQQLKNLCSSNSRAVWINTGKDAETSKRQMLFTLKKVLSLE